MLTAELSPLCPNSPTYQREKTRNDEVDEIPGERRKPEAERIDSGECLQQGGAVGSLSYKKKRKGGGEEWEAEDEVESDQEAGQRSGMKYTGGYDFEFWSPPSDTVR